MTPDEFRCLALSMPHAVEHETERRSYISSRVLSAAALRRSRARPLGPSKITFTGASTSPSTRINHACMPVTAPRIWPSYATSLSIWFAKSQTNDPSSDAASAPPGTQNTCWRYWGRCDVNLGSLPWYCATASRDGFRAIRLFSSNRPTTSYPFSS